VSIAAGSQFGAYEIVALIGSGGMERCTARATRGLG
jgi:hypothetical protein